MDSIQLKINELLMFYSGCHGNLVTIAMRYMADAYCPNEPPYQIWTKYGLRLRSYYHITVVAMVTYLNSNEVCERYLLSQGTSSPNIDSIQPKTKELVTYYFGCHGNLVTIAMRLVADAYCPK